jgi:hypothetical protein
MTLVSLLSEVILICYLIVAQNNKYKINTKHSGFWPESNLTEKFPGSPSSFTLFIMGQFLNPHQSLWLLFTRAPFVNTHCFATYRFICSVLKSKRICFLSKLMHCLLEIQRKTFSLVYNWYLHYHHSSLPCSYFILFICLSYSQLSYPFVLLPTPFSKTIFICVGYVKLQIIQNISHDAVYRLSMLFLNLFFMKAQNFGKCVSAVCWFQEKWVN